MSVVIGNFIILIFVVARRGIVESERVESFFTLFFAGKWGVGGVNGD